MTLAAARRVAVVAALTAGVWAAGTSPAAASDAIGTNGAPAPQLDWTPCDDEFEEGLECATAEVPVSYREPEGQTFELALARLPATDAAHRIGTLFVNPGGPGGSGRFPWEISPALNRRFDIVGFDPRGVADSAGVRCFANEEEATELFGWLFPTTLPQEQDVVAATRTGTSRCAENGGPMLSHASTANVARDLDLLRAAVGDKQLNYIGYSYGSHIGEVYANLFPDRVRAMTLDGVLDPREWTASGSADDATAPVTYRTGGYLGAEKALKRFLRGCQDTPSCAFRESGGDTTERFDALLASLKEEPLEFEDGEGTFQVTYQDAVYLTLGELYFAPLATELADTLDVLSDATLFRQASNSARVRGAMAHRLRNVGRPRLQSGAYSGWEWFPMVTCVDSTDPANAWAWPRFARRADRQAPHFGAAWTYLSLPCATWPARDAERYTGPWDAHTANPVLLIGNRQGDPATPYEDAKSTAQLLGNARLLTFDGWGHTAQGGLSTCIDDAVDRYFITKQPPREGKVCKPDYGPFTEPPEEVVTTLHRRADAMGAIVAGR